MHFRNSSFKHKIKRLQISQEPVYGKFYLQEMVAVIHQKFTSWKTQRKHLNQTTVI